MCFSVELGVVMVVLGEEGGKSTADDTDVELQPLIGEERPEPGCEYIDRKLQCKHLEEQGRECQHGRLTRKIERVHGVTIVKARSKL